MPRRRRQAADLGLTKQEARLLKGLEPEGAVMPLGLAGGEHWNGVFQQLLRRDLVLVYRGGRGCISDRGRYALGLLRRRRHLPAFYRGRVHAARFHATDLVRAVAELRARVCPQRRARQGTLQAVWATGSMQLVLDRRRLDGCYREAWYWVHPELLERVRQELPGPPQLVTVVAAAWRPPAATAAEPPDTTLQAQE